MRNLNLLLLNVRKFKSLCFQLLVIIITLPFASCNTDKVNPAVDSGEEIQNQIDKGEVEVVKVGNFMGAAHPTSGKVQVIKEQNGDLKLVFTNFKTDPGPDLRVYLAEDTKATGFEEISKEVKNGDVSYNLPGNINLAKQMQVLIWCKAFSVNFGSAQLSDPG